MWKSVVWITLLLGYSYAGVASWSEDISVHNNAAVTGIHYSQHESSVNAARKAAAERLQTAALVAGGGTTGPCDIHCYNSYTADGASDVETVGQGIVGFTSTGTASGAVGSSQKYSASSSRMSESSVQNVHGPVVYPAVSSTSGVRSSYSSSSSSRHSSGSAQPAAAALYSADHGRTQANFAQPLLYTVSAPQTHASQSSYERSSNERSVVSRPVVANVVYTAAPAGGSSSNSFNARSSFSAASNEQQLVQPVTYPAANSEYSGRHIAQHDHQYRQYPSKAYVMYAKPISSSVQYYAPSRSRTEESASSTSYDSSGRVVNLNHVYTPIHSERVDEQRTQQRADSVQTVQRQSDLYPARSSFDFQEKVNQEQDEDVVDGVTTDRTERLVAPTIPTSSSSSSQRRAEQQSSYVRTGSYVPNTGSTTRYSTAQTADSQRRQTYQSSPTYVAAVPVSGAGSTSNYESASESQHQQQRHSQNSLNVPLVVQPVPAGSATSSSSRYASSQQEHRSSAGGPGYYAPAGSSSYGSQYVDTAALSSSHNNRYKAGSAGSFVHYPITHDEFGRQFGAIGRAGGYGADTDLRDIMSESESLARMQAQNVHNGAVTGSGTFDTDTRFGGESDSLGTMPGGFQRTKSWSSSSKWASEQRYGEDGKPKTSSMLSTAESERHNINGKTTGYKAATTTVEDDGKVSTYSLHTT
ncbi:uncharacterized protein LOC128303897 [Anopheles moucheti]|uniref:uncharacterized protein LOC128303897 n=1 Tax=Anopheles moucheti TaxID=186751 RepID=UPI0022F0F68B|nr:uncharacterized protein LOC128303897 [Anopheles moucheti]